VGVYKPFEEHNACIFRAEISQLEMYVRMYIYIYICIYGDGGSTVLQIGRSLVRSQLVSMDFSLT